MRKKPPVYQKNSIILKGEKNTWKKKILDRKTSKSTVKTLAFILAINIIPKLTVRAIYKKNLSATKNVVKSFIA